MLQMLLLNCENEEFFYLFFSTHSSFMSLLVILPSQYEIHNFSDDICCCARILTLFVMFSFQIVVTHYVICFVFVFTHKCKPPYSPPTSLPLLQFRYPIWINPCVTLNHHHDCNNSFTLITGKTFCGNLHWPVSLISHSGLSPAFCT